MDYLEHQLARALGRRPAGDEFRAWVDHEGLSTRLRDGRALERHLSYCGLTDLSADDPALPPELRELLDARSEGWAFYVGLWAIFFFTLYTSVLTTAGILGFIEDTAGLFSTLFVVFIPSVVISGSITPHFGEWIERRHRDWFGVEPLGSRARAMETALAALRARPFVVRVGDILVENLPSLSQLVAWEVELTSEIDQAQSRAYDLHRILERIIEVSRELGESSETSHTQALRGAYAAELALQERSEEVLTHIRARAERMQAELAELRRRTELDALRAQADASLGHQHSRAEVAISTQLDLDLGELGAEVDRLRADLQDERLRARALTEVGAIRAGA